MNNLNPENVLKFMGFIHELKHLPKRTWPQNGTKKYEEAAGHTYAMSIMTLLLEKLDTKLDRLKCLQLAMVHDLPQVIIGDISPLADIPGEKKDQMDKAVLKITSYLDKDRGSLIYNLYIEYESQATPEAKFVKDLDRFDLLFIVTKYDMAGNPLRLCKPLFDALRDKFEHPLIRKLVQALEAQRNGCNETDVVFNGVKAQDVLRFLDYVYDIKHTPRRGFLIHDEKHASKDYEQVAAHMYAMGMATFLLGDDSGVDRLKCLELAIVHDLAEAIVTDITRHDGIPVDVKHKMEDDAMKEITSHLKYEAGPLIYDLYKQYEAKKTPEAKFLKDLDNFDLLITAANYEQLYKFPKKFQIFYDNLKGDFKNSFVQKLVDTLLKRTQWLLEVPK